MKKRIIRRGPVCGNRNPVSRRLARIEALIKRTETRLVRLAIGLSVQVKR